MFTVPPTEENATRQLHVHLVTRDTIVYEIRDLHILNLYSEDCSHIMSFLGYEHANFTYTNHPPRP